MTEATKSQRSTPANPETEPDIMYASVEENKYKSELEIYDRWQSFSAQMLQLALLGIAIFGFLYQWVFSGFDPNKHPKVPIEFIKLLSKASVILFAFSALFALIYRYGSTEGMMHFFRGLKNPSNNREELNERDTWLSRCLRFKLLSAACLGLGACLSAIAILVLF